MCTESGMNTSILTEYVCEIRKTALLGNWAWNMMLPFMLELTRCGGRSQTLRRYGAIDQEAGLSPRRECHCTVYVCDFERVVA